MVRLIQIPARADNYIYAVLHGSRAFVVDPSDAAPVLARLADFPGTTLEAIVNTHHHGDHVGGNRALVAATRCEVVGPAVDAARIPGIQRRIAFGETFSVAGVELQAFDVRGHTRGHIAYRTEAAADEVIRHGHRGAPTRIARLEGRPLLFVGDSLFLAGCGRLFEGTPDDLDAAMRRLAAQPTEALVCCAHEYTAANLRFARTMLPEVDAIADRLAALDLERERSGSSVPDLLERELETNPFLLALRPEIARVLADRLGLSGTRAASSIAILGALRLAKDRS